MKESIVAHMYAVRSTCLTNDEVHSKIFQRFLSDSDLINNNWTIQIQFYSTNIRHSIVETTAKWFFLAPEMN